MFFLALLLNCITLVKCFGILPQASHNSLKEFWPIPPTLALRRILARNQNLSRIRNLNRSQVPEADRIPSPLQIPILTRRAHR